MNWTEYFCSHNTTRWVRFAGIERLLCLLCHRYITMRSVTQHTREEDRNG